MQIQTLKDIASQVHHQLMEPFEQRLKKGASYVLAGKSNVHIETCKQQ